MFRLYCWRLLSALALTSSFCMADQYSGCVLEGDFTRWFWPTSIGALLSSVCFLALFVLGFLWWECDIVHPQPAWSEHTRY